MNRARLYITNGMIFLVGFISLYGLLMDAGSITKTIWEILYLVIGIHLVQSIRSKKAIFSNIVFYAANILLVLLYQTKAQANSTFFTLTIALLAVGILVLVANLRNTKRLSYLPVDAISIDGKTVAEAPAKVSNVKKKAVKKKVKKTVKKKAIKKSKK